MAATVGTGEGAGLRARLRDGEVLVGTFLNLGSALAAEICGLAGFDWVLIDLEHGAGTESELVGQLQAVRHTGAAAVVRVEDNQRPRFARALDAGAEGVMVPRVDSAEQARAASSYLRYPPEGVRGVATMNRGAGFAARKAADHVAWANERVVGIVQIESAAAVADAEAIAAADGVDVLFVGPSDLTASLGILGQTDHPRYREAVEAVLAACRRAGKAPGVLVRGLDDLEPHVAQGFRFVGIGSDGVFLANGARQAAARAREAAATAVPTR